MNRFFDSLILEKRKEREGEVKEGKGTEGNGRIGKEVPKQTVGMTVRENVSQHSNYLEHEKWLNYPKKVIHTVADGGRIEETRHGVVYLSTEYFDFMKRAQALISL